MKNIEVYSTGGGFYNADVELENGTIASIDTNYIDCISVYENGHVGEPEHMITSCSKDTLPESLVEPYKALRKALESR